MYHYLYSSPIKQTIYIQEQLKKLPFYPHIVAVIVTAFPSH